MRGGPRRGLAPVLAVAALLAGTPACSPARPGAAEGRVVLYTSMPAAVVDRLEGVIERRFPDLQGDFWVPIDGKGIDLVVVRGRTADLEARIDAEAAGGGVEADLVWLAEPSAYHTLRDAGLLARYEPPGGAPILPAYADPDGYLVAGRVICMVVAWNTSLVEGPLTDWEDLIAVEAAAFPAPQSGAARATIAALLDRFGAGFFEELAAGGGRSVASNEAALEGLIDGEFQAVAVLDFMVREAKAAGSPVDYAYPVSGTVLIPSPIAVTAAALNPGGAAAVADFILSERGQQIIVEIGSFYPVRADVAPPAGAPPLAGIPSLDPDWERLAADHEQIEAFWEGLFGAAGSGG